METYANTRWSCVVEYTSKAPVLREGSAAYQLVGEVTAHQGEDG